jgi:hypothetical protein
MAIAVLEAVRERRIPLSVNVCSLSNKLLQLRGRRRAIASLRNVAHERLTADGDCIETAVVFRFGQDAAFVHPGEVAQLRESCPGLRAFVLRRTAPRSLSDPGRLLAVHEVT